MEGFTKVRLDSGKDKGYFVVMRASFDFELKEAKKRKPSKDSDVSPPTLIFSLSASSWFSNDGNIKMEYKDNDNEPLEAQVGKIIYDMCIVANKLHASDELADRVQKRKWEEEKRQRRLEQMRKGELEELKLLELAASDWEKSQKIRRFADAIELRIAEIEDSGKKEKLLKWVKWARDKADWLDPLTAKEDELLGKSHCILDAIEDEDY